MKDRVILGFGGDLKPDSMAEFAQHRANKLSLTLEVLELDAQRARLAVTGPEDLTDAFEMALSLGPGDSLVRDVWRESNEPAGGGAPQALITTTGQSGMGQ